jgi:hypothetical protein
MDDNDGGKPKYSEKPPSHCDFVHHKSQTDGPGIDPPSLCGNTLPTYGLSDGTVQWSKDFEVSRQ